MIQAIEALRPIKAFERLWAKSSLQSAAAFDERMLYNVKFIRLVNVKFIRLVNGKFITSECQPDGDSDYLREPFRLKVTVATSAKAPAEGNTDRFREGS